MYETSYQGKENNKIIFRSINLKTKQFQPGTYRQRSRETTSKQFPSNMIE